jgi:hypothetical protein
VRSAFEPVAGATASCRWESKKSSELPTFPIQRLLDPFNVPPRWTGETKVLDLQGNQFERMEASAGRIQVDEIHQHKVVTVALVTTDPFIVVQKITAAIENEKACQSFTGILHIIRERSKFIETCRGARFSA